MIKALTEQGYMVNADFYPGNICGVSILKKVDDDCWISIGMGKGDNLVDAIEEAKVQAGLD